MTEAALGRTEDGRLGRWWTAAVGVVRVLGQAPVSIALVVSFLVLGLAASGAVGWTGMGTGSITQGRWWTLFSYGLWDSGAGGFLVATGLTLITLLPAERRLGSLRAAGIFLLCQVGGALLAIAAMELGGLAGDPWLGGLIGARTVGPTPGLVGVGLALSASLTALWRRRLRLLLVVAPLLFLFYSGEVVDVARTGAALIGLVTGVLLFTNHRSPRDFRPLPSSAKETRLLVAVFASVSALGPLVTWFTHDTDGPLALYRALFIGVGVSPASVRATCSGALANTQSCLNARVDHALANSPDVFVYWVPVCLIVVVAVGLWRGRRMAWWAAVLLRILLIAAELRYFLLRRDAATGTFTFYSILQMCIPAAVLVVLVLTRRRFQLRAERETVATFLGVAVLTFVVVGAAYIKFAYDARNQFTPVPAFHQIVSDYPKRLVPPAYLPLLGKHLGAFLPDTLHARALWEFTGPVFWVIVLVGLFVAFWRAGVRRKVDNSAQAKQLLLRYGGSTLSYMSTWPGNDHWLSADGRAAVAYRVIGSTALTLGDPYGDPDSRGAAVAEFTAYCDEHGWSPCFYSVTQGTRDVTERLGWSAVQVAEDTWLHLPDLAFTGKRWQDVRSALNRAGKAGITAHWHSWPTAPIAVQEQVRALSEEWVADKGLPEMGFTLGGLDELNDPRVRVLVALDEEGVLHGITSWLPSYEDGEPVGWTLDFMRRGDGAFQGVMEYLIATAALTFKDEGARFLSLSGAPLARVDRGEQQAPLQRVLDVLGRTLEPVYGFRSLLAFKSKFQPTYLPLYMVYPDPAQLPAIAGAIGKAYLPETSPAQMLRLSRRLTQATAGRQPSAAGRR
ncbi:bifunctional lysylphosphatidylglycerol flippase/synthetase MprF [Streptacidiphilus rugosus]|uniref:bifunctional lysylphosphatidylglycerol flippase/synthetase MprF n=1 Tax=Streptacidiphilus rugosus TaxID=405783 RepID=UPI0006909FE3|nr:phosphatidylglycerol lysyltransferase domain-containing protein [Streptacidiphilus rugosus]